VTTVDVYVGVGSNIEPATYLRRALESLRGRFPGLRASSVFRSPAWGFSGDDFLNMVVTFPSAAGAVDVERILSATEDQGGRERKAGRFNARTLDLDLLLYGQRVDPALRLPREDVLRYPFVLAPLAELAGSLTHPVTGVRVAVAWARMAAGNPAVVRVSGPEALP
jgi:2-amino-4-hydroxy-6-hydroxymethyldihydropteridine diphosphokinase